MSAFARLKILSLTGAALSFVSKFLTSFFHLLDESCVSLHFFPQKSWTDLRRQLSGALHGGSAVMLIKNAATLWASNGQP